MVRELSFGILRWNGGLRTICSSRRPQRRAQHPITAIAIAVSRAFLINPSERIRVRRVQPSSACFSGSSMRAAIFLNAVFVSCDSIGFQVSIPIKPFHHRNIGRSFSKVFHKHHVVEAQIVQSHGARFRIGLKEGLAEPRFLQAPSRNTMPSAAASPAPPNPEWIDLSIGRTAHDQ
jgi:hypothetical protein